MLVPLASMAQGDSAYCTKEASTFSNAAMFRDMGLSPQETLERMQVPPMKLAFPVDVVKDIINTVYFDREAAEVPYGRMLTTVMNLCMHPAKTFAPLN
jgi:hypothetical protein